MSKHPESVPALLTALRDLRENNPKAVRNNVHLYPAEIYGDNGEGSSSSGLRTRRITSWKMTEHLYRSANNPFPTLARGLFTEVIEAEDGIPPGLTEGRGREEKERIVARGYDKFFNIDEVAWTSWDSMKRHSAPPYHLTLKSNGCLILISALTPSHLLVASKHSLGTITETDQADTVAPKEDDSGKKVIPGSASAVPGNKPGHVKDKGKAKEEKPTDAQEKEDEAQDQAHAAVGRAWVKKSLSRNGKTEADLARRLWEGNLTAVLELCDDSFEEHVIATPEHWTGLHLHGLNHNTPHFSTLPPDQVASFAKDFGFILTKAVELEDLDAVNAFTDDVARTGSWEGDMIEGFVVRGTVRDHQVSDDSPPYRAGAPFFFKIKFEEPYLLYRQWREITRTMLPLVDKALPQEKRDDIWSKVRKRVRRPEVAVYADWAGEVMKSDPALFDDFNRGIVRVRNQFLQWTENEGKGAWTQAQAGAYKLKGQPKFQHIANGKAKAKEAERDTSNLPKKWVLVPCAVPGTGKTMVGLALSKLYDIGHTQSDDVTTKKSAPTFLKNIANLLQKHDIVYADRNNHIDKHYNELRDINTTAYLKQNQGKDLMKYNICIMVIVWDIQEQPYHRALRIASERVINRGDNHQTLRPDLTMNAEHEAVVSKFIRDFTVPDETQYHHYVSVSIDDKPEQLVRKIIDQGISGHLDLPTKSDDEIRQAITDAKEYTVTTPYHPPQKLGHAIRYFGIAPEIDLTAIVEIGIYHMNPELAHSAQRFLFKLQQNNGVVATPHITLVHGGDVKGAETAIGDKEKAEPEQGVKAEEIPKVSETISAEQTRHERIWNTCKRLSESKSVVMWDFDMTHLVWDDRIMAIVVDNLHPRASMSAEEAKGNSKKADSEGVDELVHEEAKQGVHITVGMKEGIKAFEARGIVKLVRSRISDGEVDGTMTGTAEGSGEIKWASLGVIKGEGRVKGMY